MVQAVVRQPWKRCTAGAVAVDVDASYDGHDRAAARRCRDEAQLEAPRQIHDANDIQQMVRGLRPPARSVVAQILDAVHTHFRLQRIGSGELKPIREALVGLDQHRGVGLASSRYPERNGAVGALDASGVPLCSRTDRDHRRLNTTDGPIELVEVDSVRATRIQFVHENAPDEVHREDQVVPQLPLHTDVGVIAALYRIVAGYKLASRLADVDRPYGQVVLIRGRQSCRQKRCLLLKNLEELTEREIGNRGARQQSADRDRRYLACCRSHTNIDDALKDVGVLSGRLQDTSVAKRADFGAFLQSPVELLGVVIETGAGADYSLIVIPHIPGESERRREIAGVVLGWAQIVPVERRQECGFGEVIVEEIAFVLPSHAVVQRKFRLQLPSVLAIEAEAIIHFGYVDVIRRWLAGVAQASRRAGEWQVQEVLVGSNDLRQVREEGCYARRSQRADEKFRRVRDRARRVAITPETGSGVMLQQRAKADAMRA